MKTQGTPFDWLRVRYEVARRKDNAQWHAELVEASKLTDSRIFEAMTALAALEPASYNDAAYRLPHTDLHGADGGSP